MGAILKGEGAQQRTNDLTGRMVQGEVMAKPSLAEGQPALNWPNEERLIVALCTTHITPPTYPHHYLPVLRRLHRPLDWSMGHQTALTAQTASPPQPAESYRFATRF